MKNENIKVIQQECPEFVSEIEKTTLDFKKLNYLTDLYLNPLLKKDIEEIILGCSHYPLIYKLLKNKMPLNIRIIDPSVALVNKFNNSFLIQENRCCNGISYEKVKFFVTSKSDEFSKKVKF